MRVTSAASIGRDLHVTDERQVRFEAADEVTADDLHVIEVELNAHVRRADPLDDVGSVLDAAEEIIRAVAWIERLYQQRNADACRLARRANEIPNENSFRGRPLSGRYTAGKAMDRGPADRGGIVERALERGLPVALATRQRGKPGFPLPAEWRVDAELRQAMARQLRFHGIRPDIVGILQFDRGKSRRSGRAEALQRRALGEQKCEVGGQAGHVRFIPTALGSALSFPNGARTNVPFGKDNDWYCELRDIPLHLPYGQVPIILPTIMVGEFVVDGSQAPWFPKA
jgi:hypothetical protein